MTVAGLLLAAGGGQRFGAPKATAVVAGETLVDRGIATLRQGGCEPLIVVAGAEAAAVTSRSRENVDVVVNTQWSQGLATSLQVGLARCAQTTARAVVVALVDQPLVTPTAIARLVAAWREGATAAVASYDGQPRNPVLLTREVWADVAASAGGEAGARSWLRAHPDLITEVACGDVSSPEDIDTPADLQRIERRLAALATSRDCSSRS